MKKTSHRNSFAFIRPQHTAAPLRRSICNLRLQSLTSELLHFMHRPAWNLCVPLPEEVLIDVGSDKNQFWSGSESMELKLMAHGCLERIPLLAFPSLLLVIRTCAWRFIVLPLPNTSAGD